MPGIRGLSSSAAEDGMAERHRLVDGPGGVGRLTTASWREHDAAAVSVRRAWRRRSIDADMIGSSKMRAEKKDDLFAPAAPFLARCDTSLKIKVLP
jgi:hypothetical protein